MDSTLLDQIRHLCRDRAAYEHLKAILVQQERVHQLNLETLQIELNDLRQTVAEIAKSEVKSLSNDNLDEQTQESGLEESELEELEARIDALIEVSQPLLTKACDDDQENDQEPAIDPQFIETILSTAGNDSRANNFLLEVIDSYLEAAPCLVQEIDMAIAEADHPKLLQLLNTLRSSSDFIGALVLSSHCRQLESVVKANNAVLIYENLSQVAIEVQRVTEALRIERLLYEL